MSTPSPIPDWLEELQRADKPPSAKQTPPAAQVGLPLDWLEDIRQIEESLRARPAPTAPPRPTAAPLRPQPAPPVRPDQCGYDPATGRILDPVAYDRWQKAEAQRRQAELQKQPTVSVSEAFLDAQRAIQAWVDEDVNKPLVTSGDVEAIRRSASVHTILRHYEGYGPVMREKLWKRLFFLVDNRKKFFKAFG